MLVNTVKNIAHLSNWLMNGRTMASTVKKKKKKKVNVMGYPGCRPCGAKNV